MSRNALPRFDLGAPDDTTRRLTGEVDERAHGVVDAPADVHQRATLAGPRLARARLAAAAAPDAARVARADVRPLHLAARGWGRVIALHSVLLVALARPHSQLPSLALPPKST